MTVLPHVLVRRQVIRRSPEETFAFFADAENLERITPPRLKFEITTPKPIVMRAGARIDYALRLFGVPFRWRTLIEVYEPPRRFVDVQIEGPYRSWRHLHVFSRCPRGTEMRDRVEYALPFGPIGELARRFFVKGQLEAIFDFRSQSIASAFPVSP